MNNEEKITFKEAIYTSPGPLSKKETLILYLKGFSMGSADIVPGVSGGTIAFITGIYKDLIEAIKSIDKQFIKLIFSLKFSEALARVHLRFLLVLFAGIISAVLVMSHLVSFLLDAHKEELWSFFFGLIIASVLLMAKKVKKLLGVGGLSVMIGACVSYIVVGLIPVETPVNLLFIFLTGAIAISAMILPGISGAFILLLLGKYEYLVSAIKNPFDPGNLVIVAIFLTGCLVGILTFARFVSWTFKEYYNISIAILTGLVLGSLRKIWPWKEVLEEKSVGHTNYVLLEQNIIPEPSSGLMMQIALIVIGFSFVYFLESFSSRD